MTGLNPDNVYGRNAIIIMAVFTALDFVAFGVRMYSRRVQKHSLDASDLTCFLALLILCGWVAATSWTMVQGTGMDVNMVPLPKLENILKNNVTAQITWSFSVNLVRISMILLYLRIFTVRSFKLIGRAVLALQVVTMVIVFVLALGICTPLEKQWMPQMKTGHCGDRVKANAWISVWNLLMDLTVVILPMPYVWRLQILRKKKLGLTALFGIGIIICFISGARTVIQLDFQVANVTRQWAIIADLSTLEPTLGIFNACLPFTPAVARRIAATEFYSRARSTFSLKKLASKSDNASGKQEAPSEDGSFQRLPGAEMGPTASGDGTSLNSTERAKEDVAWDQVNKSSRIGVRKDISVEQEIARV